MVAKATEKEQDKRYQSAAEFRVALDAIGTGVGPSSKPWIYYSGGGVLGLILLVMTRSWSFCRSKKVCWEVTAS